MMQRPKRDKLSTAYTELHALECTAKHLEKKLAQVRKAINAKKRSITHYRDRLYND